MAQSTKAALSDLHGFFSEILKEGLTIEKGKLVPLTDDAGNVIAPAMGMNPAFLNVVRAFLKDNEITGGIDDEALQNLRQEFNNELISRRDAANKIVSASKDLPNDDLLIH